TGPDGRFSLPRPVGPARVTAAGDGYLIAGADAAADPLVLTLAPVPEEDCESYAWVDPGPDPARMMNCGNCHTIAEREWSASGHARAVANPRFRNLYDDLLADLPAGAGVCAACHAPTAEPDAASDYDIRRVTGVAARGVHCDFCHKVAGPGGGDLGLTHG